MPEARHEANLLGRRLLHTVQDGLNQAVGRVGMQLAAERQRVVQAQ